MQKQNPLLRIWGWGKDEHGRLIGAVISALIAVLLGMLPYLRRHRLSSVCWLGKRICPFICHG